MRKKYYRKRINQRFLKKKSAGFKSRTQGTINIISSGAGYVSAEEFDEDIYIPFQFLNTALNGDKVEVFLFPYEKGEKTSGKISKVIERKKTEFVGSIVGRKTGFFLIPDDKKVHAEILINSREKLKEGQKAFVRVLKWENPEGEIIKLLGLKGENDVEMESIVLEKGFDAFFDPKFLKEADRIKKINQKITQEEINKRRDFRHINTFTIDPFDAKDFDDALSVREKGDVLEIGVHIADVSFYVREKTILDQEARKRGSSIYLVDRTISMLPEALSNDLCSLIPNTDKLTFSVVFEFSKNKIKSFWIGPTIINSNARLTYEKAQSILDKKQGPFFKELDKLNALAHIFRQERIKAGALSFEQDEMQFELDKNGKPIRIYRKERIQTNKLIEEFMVLANQKVAERFTKNFFFFRIHDLPKEEEIKKLFLFLKAIGIETSDYFLKQTKASSKILNNALERIEGKPQEFLVKNTMMRAMAKACYSVQNKGHYGLALNNYTHFTSPIRRYADLAVHRIVKKYLTNQTLNSSERLFYQKTAQDLTQKEIDAQEAERDSIAFKQVEYMLERVGLVFSGIVSGITQWGIYVQELDTKTEGMVSLQSMKDDFYVLDKENYCLIGTRRNKRYAMGDKVKIKVMGGDLERKTLDFSFV